MRIENGKWRLVKLGDIFKISSGGTPLKSKPEYYENGTIQWVRTGDLKDKYITKVEALITEEALNNSSAKLFPVDTVLIAMYGATIGACSILLIKAATNQACAAFLPNKEVDSSFLYYFLCSKKNDFIKMGVGGAQPNISATILKGIKFPLPPLKTQKQIAKTLDTAAELLAMRKQQLVELDNLIKSTFYDMFGDPVANEKGWEVKTLDDICNKITDGEHINPTFINDGIKMVMANNVRNDLNFNGCKYISDKDYRKFSKKCNPEFGDILLVSRGATIGRTCINSSLEKFCLMGSVILLKPKDNCVVNYYLLSWLQNERIRPYISTTSSASAQQAIYMKDLKKRSIICPPIPLQTQFAEIVTKIEEQKALVQKAIDETQYLFDSLMSEYFE